MNIVIVQGAFFPVPPTRGGAVEKIWFNLGIEFSKIGHHVTHISKQTNDSAIREVIENVRHERVKGYKAPKSKIKLKLLDLIYSIRAIKKIPEKTDIIITNTFWAPLLLRGDIGKKVYVSVERAPKWQMKFYTHVSRLRGCSPSICNEIFSNINEKYHKNVVYIPNPVPFAINHQQTTKKNCVLYVGRLHPEKGVDVLIDAFNAIQPNLKKDWQLIIVGPHEIEAGGGGSSYLNLLSSKLKGNNNIKIEGAIYDEQKLKGFYADAKIFCYPAQNGSGDAAPVSPREAMANRTVPIVSSLPVFDDLIHHEKNGLLYDQNEPAQIKNLMEALTRLMSDPNLLNTLAENGYNFVQRFSIKTIANEFLDDFKKIQAKV